MTQVNRTLIRLLVLSLVILFFEHKKVYCRIKKKKKFLNDSGHQHCTAPHRREWRILELHSSVLNTGVTKHKKNKASREIIQWTHFEKNLSAWLLRHTLCSLTVRQSMIWLESSATGWFTQHMCHRPQCHLKRALLDEIKATPLIQVLSSSQVFFFLSQWLSSSCLNFCAYIYKHEH